MPGWGLIFILPIVATILLLLVGVIGVVIWLFVRRAPR